MKKYWLGIALMMLFSMAHAQSSSLTPKEKQQIQLLREFAQYLKKTDVKSINSHDIRKRFLAVSEKPDSTSSVGWAQREALLDTLLKVTKLTLDSLQLEEYNAVPWPKFPQPDSLPRMVWEAPPVDNLFGQPIPTHNWEKEKAVGKRQQENTLVVYKKTAPNSPLYYVLFNEKNGKIASWLLISQGSYHYFLGY